MKKILLLASLLGLAISAQAATMQCPPGNAITYDSYAKTWVLDKAYASQWNVFGYTLGKDKEQVYTLAVLKTFVSAGQLACKYSYTIDSRGEISLYLSPNGSHSVSPSSNPYFHQIPGTTDYLCITSAASPEVCPVVE